MQKSAKLSEEKLASDILKEVADTNNNDSDKVTLFDIKTALHERGFGILIIYLLFTAISTYTCSTWLYKHSFYTFNLIFTAASIWV